MTRTTFATAEDGSRARAVWHVVDAKGQVLGRMATQIAQVLMGKHSPLYTPHLSVGEGVIVINAAQVRVTGNKKETRVYRYYTGHIGGLREKTLGEYLEKKPEELIKLAVRRMLPKNKMGKRILARLKVYAGSEHPHAAQAPRQLDI